MRYNTALISTASFLALAATSIPSGAQTASAPSTPSRVQEQESNQSITSSANSAPTGAKQTQGDQGGLSDIIITARKRSESAQKVPIAVSVVTSATLQQHQVTNAYELVNLTPSLQVQSANQQVGAVNFAVRGIGTTVFGIAESSVGVVIDDVVMSKPQFGKIEFFDLDRVEVLRGPQGMLFGKNAAAGLINIVTAQPVFNRTELIANAIYGNTTAPGPGNVATFDVAANAPVGSNAALRLSAFVNRHDAFVRDIALNQDLGSTVFGGRFKFLWKPTAGLSLTAAGDYQHEHGPGEGVLIHTFTAPGGLIATIDARNGIFASSTGTRMATDVPDKNRYDLYGGSLKAELELGAGYTLTNILGHRVHKNTNSLDTDTTTADLFNTNAGGSHDRQTTEELRLTSPVGPFSYQVGLFYLDLRSRSHLLQGGNLGVPMPPGTSLIGGLLSPSSVIKSYAGFFEGQAKLTDALRFTAGARYTHDIIEYNFRLTNPAALLPLYGPDYQLSRETKNNNISYRFGLDYSITNDVLAYATYSRGYKGPTFDALTGTKVAEEIPKSIELGIKSTIFDRRLRLNVALFRTLFDGYQTQAQKPGSTAGFITLNAGQLKTKGVEVEFTAKPVQGLTLSGGTTYNHTEYVNLPGVPCYYGQPTGTSGTNVCLPNRTTDVSGNQLANAPQWTTSVTARYEHPVSRGWVGFLQGDVYHRTSFYFTQTRDPHTRVPSNAIVGISAGAHTGDDRLVVTAFVRNLFDKRVPSYIIADPVAGAYVGPTGRSDAALGGDYWSNFGPNSFRTVGLSLSYRTK